MGPYKNFGLEMGLNASANANTNLRPENIEELNYTKYFTKLIIYYSYPHYILDKLIDNKYLLVFIVSNQRSLNQLYTSIVVLYIY